MNIRIRLRKKFKSFIELIVLIVVGVPILNGNGCPARATKHGIVSVEHFPSHQSHPSQSNTQANPKQINIPKKQKNAISSTVSNLNKPLYLPITPPLEIPVRVEPGPSVYP